MKRIKLLLIMAIAANFAVAQNTNVVNAYNYNRDAQTEIKLAETLKAQNKADKAAKRMDGAKTLMGKSKAAIDQASTHESTQSQPKTWHYYGITYYMIGTYPEFSDLEPNAYDKSLNAFVKVKQLDEKYYKDNQMDIASHIISIADNYFNTGTLSFNDGNYADAAAKYLNAFEAKKAINVTDEGALTNAALSFYKAQQFDKALESYQQVANLGKEDAYTYYYMAECYRNLENKDKMIEIVNIGRQKFPENNDLINEQINAYLNAKREVEIIDQIKDMAEANSDQPIYYFILGNIYGNAESTLFNIDEAVACYDKAITADINYADAYINVGSLYIDQAAGLYKNAEEVWENKNLDFNAQIKASDEYTEQGKAFDEKAMPYVEKAHELLPDDEAIKQALRGIYTRLKLTEKAAGLN